MVVAAQIYVCDKMTWKLYIHFVHTYCTNISFLVLMLYKNYVRCNHWRQLGQMYGASLYYLYNFL